MERIRGDAETGSDEGVLESHMHLRVAGATSEPEGPRRSASDRTSDVVRERLAGLGDRASEATDHLLHSMTHRLERAGTRLEERTGIVAAIRAHPLTSVGLTFSTAFLIAAVTGSDDRNWVVERMRRRIRATILSSITAVLAHELRGVLGAGRGLGDFVESFLDDDEDDDLDDEEFALVFEFDD